MIERTLTNIRNWSKRPEAPAQTTVFLAMLFVVSLPTAPFLLSISMWGLVFVAFWNTAKMAMPAKNPQRAWKAAWAILEFSFRRLFRHRVYAVFVLLLLVPFFSGLWSTDQAYWLDRVRVRLPFLVLPWAFVNMPVLTERQLRLVLYFLVGFMAVLCVGVGVNYYLNHSTIMAGMYQGRPIPVPRNHIRFSLLLATAIIAGGRLWYAGFVWRYRWERSALAAVVVFLFVFLHFLSVRSGLAALYIALVFTVLRFVWNTRRWQTSLLALALLIASPWLAMEAFPSLRQKLDYTAYDWQQYRENTGETYSDAERWISLKTGWLIWQDHPWWGAGAGDLRQETERVVAIHFPGYLETPKLPHNQFLYILAGTGLVGLLLSLYAFFYPVFAAPQRSDYLFAAFQCIALSSFLVEYTIETAMGVAWYLFFTLWLCKMAEAGNRLASAE